MSSKTELEFGAFMRQKREEKEIGLREMAKIIGVSPTYVSKFERDEFPPPAEDKVRKIAAILDIDVDVLLALAGKVSSDLSEIIREHPRELAALLRTTKGMTADDEDPDGIDQHQAGAKLDSRKPKVDLMLSGFSRALLAVAEVTTYGATKYSINGWQEVKDPIARYSQAKARHMMQGYTETYDQESSLHHAAHEAWNALAVLEFIIRGEEDEKTR